MDDCWARSRDSNERSSRLVSRVPDSLAVVPDTDAFPNFAEMIEYIHNKGLLFGLYSDGSEKTCAGLSRARGTGCTNIC